ncbi:MAG: acetyl-CoA carboxylase biotin carboxylase subunit [Candidatus Aminicenantes bacterium RBG_13_59_9]|nr:MAG: acetyl-CoA carboxylase biotin carboxylase subunit [Candidatus Aminicenantes bacterium RBG_13_59_9]
MFKKILVANRGEIAIRVLRACKEMGITGVAVYSDADRLALHVTYADEAYHIGPSPSRESYLAIDRIIGAAKKSGAEAIHPGYGFLAENAAFAAACETAGIVFIGPRPEAIRRMGHKLEARETMRAAGVPVIPGSDGPIGSPAKAAAVAKDIGYPVMIKAAAGGGGKGMRVVRAEAEFGGALKMTMGEAESAFGDPSVYLEKFIERSKHIEVQLLADGHGGVVTLGERECSMQRRYQKVIEEAPSPVVDADLRAALSEAAGRAARAVDYLGAGTVEFTLGQDRTFCFLEMNTRLQVEHPVTELIYGVDLVKEQFRIAAGEPLSIRQADVKIRGHALETRLYAEDPQANFMPSTGLIKHLMLPEGPGVRNDNGIYPGLEIPIHYDPLLGKMIVWGQDRATAIRRCKRALEEYQVDGVKTNIEFLLWVLDEPAFIDGSYDTTFIDRHFKPGCFRHRPDDLELAAIAGSITAYRSLERMNLGRRPEAHESAWRRAARAEGLRGARPETPPSWRGRGPS